MHNGCWTLGRDFGETLEVVDMMTRLIHPSTPPNFLLENQDGVKTIVSEMIAYAYHFFYFKTFQFTLIFIFMLSLKWQQKLYELVVRHFLACVSKPALGAETTVEIDIAGEQFSACGRVILEVRFLSHAMYSLPKYMSHCRKILSQNNWHISLFNAILITFFFPIITLINTTFITSNSIYYFVFMIMGNAPTLTRHSTIFLFLWLIHFFLIRVKWTKGSVIMGRREYIFHF